MAGAQPGRGIGEQWFECELRCPKQRCVIAKGGGHDPHESAGGAQDAPIQLGLKGRTHERVAGGQPAAEDDRSGLRMLIVPARPIPSQRPVSANAARAIGSPASAAARTPSTAS